MVWLSQLELKSLQNCLVVLVLVLQHHVVHVSAREERVRFIEVSSLEPIENFFPDLVEPLFHVGERRNRQTRASRTRVLERIVNPGHLREFDFSVEVLRKPKLLEMRDVTEIPKNGTHQRIVLTKKILVRQSVDDQ